MTATQEFHVHGLNNIDELDFKLQLVRPSISDLKGIQEKASVKNFISLCEEDFNRWKQEILDNL